MNIRVSQTELLSQTCDLLVIGVPQSTVRLTGHTASVDKVLGGVLSELMTSRSFDGKLGKYLLFPSFGKVKAREIALVGLGSKDTFDVDALRKIGGLLIKIAREHHTATIAMPFLGHDMKKGNHRAGAQAFTEGVLLGGYRFDACRGIQHVKKHQPLEVSTLSIIETDKKIVGMIEDGIKTGHALAEATNFARELVNTPSADMTPAHLVAAAKKLAVRGSSITCTILSQTDMEKLGMRAALAVARGSVHPPFGIHLSYRPRKAKKCVALVGKAVTFDSGGLSLKPADGMMTMKIDMAGAASVLGAFKALSSIKPNVEVHGVCLAVENMPSGNAYRPGDVVTAMDGTTIEILNTDAEGRVTLADALTYAQRVKPDVIIDLATLTGACVSALGEQIAGLMSNNDRLAEKLRQVSEETGELLWRLPLFEGYASMIRSKIADIKNITSERWGGALTAGLFLRTFVNKIPWAHLDIAGPSYTEKETRPDQPYGASGYGVRLLIKFLEEM